MLQADTHLYREQWAEAHARNQAVDRLAAPLWDRLLRDRIAEQRTLISRQVAAQVERHPGCAGSHRPATLSCCARRRAGYALGRWLTTHRCTAAVDTAADTAWQGCAPWSAEVR
ncbi:MAG: hypothetical protein R2838_06295 [Caldilineaceae bacterium]